MRLWKVVCGLCVVSMLGFVGCGDDDDDDDTVTCTDSQTLCDGECVTTSLVTVTGVVQTFGMVPAISALGDVQLDLMNPRKKPFVSLGKTTVAKDAANGNFTIADANDSCQGLGTDLLLVFADDPEDSADDFYYNSGIFFAAGRPTGTQALLGPANVIPNATLAAVNTNLSRTGTNKIEETGAILVGVLDASFQPVAGATVTSDIGTVEYPQMLTSGAGSSTDGSGVAAISGVAFGLTATINVTVTGGGTYSARLSGSDPGHHVTPEIMVPDPT